MQRPTAEQALKSAWLTTHSASETHDLSAGLRENFDPRARWRSAIASAKAIGRFGSFSAMAAAAREKEEQEALRASTEDSLGKHRGRTASSESGGWRSGAADDDDGVSDSEGWRQPLATSSSSQEEWLGDSLKKTTPSLLQSPAGNGKLRATVDSDEVLSGNIVVSKHDDEEEDAFPLPRSRSNTNAKPVSQQHSRTSSPPPPIPEVSTSRVETADSALGGPVYNEPEEAPAPAPSSHRRSLHSVDLRMPGSFHWSDSDVKPSHANPSEPHQQAVSGWAHLFKKLTLQPT